MSGAARRPPRPPAPVPGGPVPPQGGTIRRSEWIRLLLGIVGLCGIVFTLPQVDPLATTWGFRAAPATVETITRQIFPASRSFSFSGHAKFRPWTRHQESVVYRYTVDGRSYVGSDTLSGVTGTQLTIYYDPAQPGRSVAAKPGAVRILSQLVLSFGLVFYGFGGRKRRARERAAAAGR